MNLPAPHVEIDGKEVFGQSMQLIVKVPEEQDSVALNISIDPPSVFPTQTFTVKLRVAVKKLPEPLRAEDPITSLSDPPQLKIPWGDDDGIPQGVVPISPWQRWLGELRSRRGFNINNVANPNSFSLFDRQKATFHVTPQKRVMVVNGKRDEYWEYTFSRKFEAEAPGKYNLGRAILQGKLVKTIVGQARAQMDTVYAISPEVTFVVKDAPETGRPASYVGVVGSMQPTVSLNPTTGKVGDPMTLTIRLHGSGLVANATAPDLLAVPAIGQAFKVYDATEEQKGDDRVFTYSLRPQNENVTEFSSIPLSYFDPIAEQFIETYTAAIPVTIEKAENIASNEIAIATHGGSPDARVQLSEDGIYGNIADMSALRNQSVNPRSWLVAFGTVIAAYIGSLFVIKSVNQRAGDVSGRRRRNAVSVAKNALQNIAPGPGKYTADAISSALIGCVADLVGREQHGLTSLEAAQLLKQRDVSESVTDEFNSILSKCDAAQYGAEDGSPTALIEQSAGLIDRIASELGATS
ncbi:MAG: hypothetical protein ACI9HK_004496 [Pirellulaceae bacterium]